MHAPAGLRVFQIGPGHLEYGPHGDPGSPAVAGIAAGMVEQDCLHTQCRGRPDDRANIRRIGHIFQDRDPARAGSHRLHARQDGPPHTAEQAPGHGDVGQLADGLRRSRKYRDVRQALQHFGSFSKCLASLHQSGERLTARCQGPRCDPGRLGNEQASIRGVIMPQLGLVQPGVHIQSWILIICNLDQFFFHSSASSCLTRTLPSIPAPGCSCRFSMTLSCCAFSSDPRYNRPGS